jgi:methionyl-tRNA formyltransferase
LTTPLNIIFAGTPDFAARHLQALIDSKHRVVAVYSQPDRPAGRGKKLQASSVKTLAQNYGIPIFQPESLKSSEAQRDLAELAADIMVVVAYGLILPTSILNTPKQGCLNVHGSLLPKWRGAAPIQRSIWAGDRESGVTIMQMDEGLDTGAMLLKKSILIEEKDSSESLYEKLAKIGPVALIETLDNLSSLEPEVQNNQLATYAHKLSKQEARLDWQLSAEQLERNIRAFNPWPAAFFEVNNLAIKVWKASVVPLIPDDKNAALGEILSTDKFGIIVATAEQAIRLETIQLPGKKPLAVSEVLNGRSEWFQVGSTLS